MQELEKILGEIGELRGQAGSECTSEDHYIKKAWEHCLDRVVGIILKHMNNGWISVEDRVPKEEGYKVLVCNKKGNIDTGIYSPYTKQWFIGNISALGKDIIAWRPLPEPYRPERSDNNDGE